MSEPRFKIAYVPWYRPIRLAARNENGFDFIGWVWRQRARQVKSMNYGWIAFLDDQTDEKLRCCPCCNRPYVEETPIPQPGN